MSCLRLVSPGPDQTRELGRGLGRLALPGDVFLLVGDLGTGKTCLTQGIAWGLGIQEYASSPTFVIMHELHGRMPLYHIDLYRLDDVAEVADLGLDDYLYGGGICVVEWADKGLAVMPTEHLLVEIAHVADTERGFTLTPKGRRFQDLMGRFRDELPADVEIRCS